MFNPLSLVKSLINWTESQHLGQYKIVFTQKQAIVHCEQIAASQITKEHTLLP